MYIMYVLNIPSLWLQLWDLDELLQGVVNTMPDHPDAADGDSDGMDVDDSIPKPSKSISSLSLSRS